MGECLFHLAERVSYDFALVAAKRWRVALLEMRNTIHPKHLEHDTLTAILGRVENHINMLKEIQNKGT